MPQSTINDHYSGMVEEDLSVDQLARLFDAIWGVEARSLPFFPVVIGGVTARWTDGEGTVHKADLLDQVLEAFAARETALIEFEGRLEGKPQARFVYRPASREGAITASASELEPLQRAIDAVKAAFPLVPRFLFISYATVDLDVATFVAELLEARVPPSVSVFVAKRDIAPGRDPRKTMLEEQLLRAEALVALCSFDSKQAGWLWWEASSVWTRGKLVAPLFLDLGAGEFDGPLTLVCQGRDLFEPHELAEALTQVVTTVGGESPVVLTDDELARLMELAAEYAIKKQKRDPVREQRLKEMLQVVLDLKDAAFAAYDHGLNWNSGMANGQAKMRTLLKQLAEEAFPPEVNQYATASPAITMSLWQTVYSAVDFLLTRPGA
jgi:hypothetical protein